MIHKHCHYFVVAISIDTGSHLDGRQLDSLVSPECWCHCKASTEGFHHHTLCLPEFVLHLEKIVISLWIIQYLIHKPGGQKHEINKTKRIWPHDFTWTFVTHVVTNIKSGISDRTIWRELQSHWFTSEKEELSRRIGSSKFIQKSAPRPCNQIEKN